MLTLNFDGSHFGHINLYIPLQSYSRGHNKKTTLVRFRRIYNTKTLVMFKSDNLKICKTWDFHFMKLYLYYIFFILGRGQNTNVKLQLNWLEIETMVFEIPKIKSYRCVQTNVNLFLARTDNTKRQITNLVGNWNPNLGNLQVPLYVVYSKK